MTVTQGGLDDNGEVTIALNRDLELDSVTTGNSVLDNAGLTVNNGTSSTVYGAGGMVIAGGPSVTTTGINAGNLVITNVAPGAIGAASTNAINGSQLFAIGASFAQAVGPNTTYNPVTNSFDFQVVIGGTTYTTLESALQAASGGGAPGSSNWVVTTGSSGSGVANGSTNQVVSDGNTVQFNAGSNMVVTQTDSRVEYALSSDLTGLNSVSIAGGPTIDRSGVDMNGGTIRNLADGVAPTDAVNVRQLQSGVDGAILKANTYTDQVFAQVNFDLRGVERDARAGTASAMAMSSVPQAFEPGMGIMGFGASIWQGEQAFAIGFSKASDNGRVIVKATGTVNSRNEAGGAVGVGFQF